MAANRTRVQVRGSIGKSIRFPTGVSGAGATLGVDFKLPDGSVPTLQQLAAALVTGAATQDNPGNINPGIGGAPLIWQNIQYVPPQVIYPARHVIHEDDAGEDYYRMAIAGPIGPRGLSGFDTRFSEDVEDPGLIPGATGAQGATGPAGSTGSGAPGVTIPMYPDDAEDPGLIPGATGAAGPAGATGIAGPAGTASSLVYVNTTVPGGNTVSNTSVETFFTSAYSIPANSLAVGTVVRVKMYGVYSTAVVAPTLRGRLYFGTTLMLDTGALTTVASITNGGWSVDGLFTVQAIGASGSVESQGYAEFSSAATTSLSVNMDNTAAVTIDTTVAKILQASVQWGGTVGASDTITLREMTVEVMAVGSAPTGRYPGTVADLTFWFQADLPLVSTGNALGTLANSTPWNTGQVASGGAATRSATLLNTLGVLAFPGTSASTYLYSAGLTLSKTTIFYVLKPATVTANATLTNGTASGCLGCYIDTTGHPSLVATGVAVIGASTTALTLNTWTQVNVTYDSSSGAYAFRVGRSAAGSGTNIRTINALTGAVGADNSGTSPLNGDLAELIIYNRVLTGTEITNVENYLNTKWGV